MAQSWAGLLFAHWRVPAHLLRLLIPAALELDTYEGEAWLGIVPFYMRDVHPRGTVNVPGLSAFPELNVRTYVTRDNKPGVWFFSLDAASCVAVNLARRLFYLPYFRAAMSSVNEGEWAHYCSVRTDSHAASAAFEACYRPITPVYFAEAGSLDHWLTERYCLYSVDKKERLYRGEIQHARWSLQHAEAKISQNTMADGLGISLPDEPPLLHYVERLDVLTWYLERLSACFHA
jgi:uncharacterized protein YqjF (DUF2071 family)